MPTVGLTLAGEFGHLASGGGWKSTITLVNTGTASLEAWASIFSDDGSPLGLPMPSFDRVIDSGASLSLSSLDSPSVVGGWGELWTAGDIDGFAVIRYDDADHDNNFQEAAIPLETRTAKSYTVVFDDTGRMETGIGLANATEQPASIPVTIRDASGAALESGTVELPAHGHTSFILADVFKTSAGNRGSAEFDTPDGGRIAITGTRALVFGVDAFKMTGIPAVTGDEPGTGSLAQVVSGGGWQTTFTFVNTGALAGQVQLRFFDETGDETALPFPQPASQTLGPGAVLTMTAADSGALQVGSAQITADRGIAGFATLRYNPSGQEAGVPIETRTATTYVLPFDNSAGYATGVALANVAATGASVSLLIRDETGAVIGSGALPLGPRGHTSFMLADRYGATAGKRGTMEVTATAGAQLSVLGLRGADTGALITLPAFAE